MASPAERQAPTEPCHSPHSFGGVGGSGVGEPSEADPAALAEAEVLKEEGNTALRRGDCVEAVQLYTEALALAPVWELLLTNRSAAHSHAGNYDLALEDAESAIALAPEWSRGYKRAAYAYYMTGQYAASAKFYRRAHDLDPSDANCASDLAIAETKRAAGEHALFIAIQGTNVKEVKRLANSGSVDLACVDPIDIDGRQPLMHAAYLGHPGVVNALLRAGANVNAVDLCGRSPLWFAAAEDQEEAAQLLIDAGADPAATDNQGQSILEVAKACEAYHVLITLAKSGAVAPGDVGDIDSLVRLAAASRRPRKARGSSSSVAVIGLVAAAVAALAGGFVLWKRWRGDGSTEPQPSVGTTGL